MKLRKYAAADVHGAMGCNQKRFTLVYCPDPYPTAACPKFHVGCRLSRELLTLPVCCRQCPWSQTKKALSYSQCGGNTSSPLNSSLSRVSHWLGRELFDLPSYISSSPWFPNWRNISSLWYGETVWWRRHISSIIILGALRYFTFS